MTLQLSVILHKSGQILFLMLFFFLSLPKPTSIFKSSYSLYVILLLSYFINFCFCLYYKISFNLGGLAVISFY